jgi:hypothetical protein
MTTFDTTVYAPRFLKEGWAILGAIPQKDWVEAIAAFRPMEIKVITDCSENVTRLIQAEHAHAHKTGKVPLTHEFNAKVAELITTDRSRLSLVHAFLQNATENRESGLLRLLKEEKAVLAGGGKITSALECEAVQTAGEFFILASHTDLQAGGGYRTDLAGAVLSRLTGFAHRVMNEDLGDALHADPRLTAVHKVFLAQLLVQHGAEGIGCAGRFGWASGLDSKSIRESWQVNPPDDLDGCLAAIAPFLDVYEGTTPDDWTSLVGGHAPADIIGAFVRHMPDRLKNGLDKTGMTFLHRAVAANRPDLATLLISKGCDVLAQNAWGQTPVELHEVQSAIHENLVEWGWGETAPAGPSKELGVILERARLQALLPEGVTPKTLRI